MTFLYLSSFLPWNLSVLEKFIENSSVTSLVYARMKNTEVLSITSRDIEALFWWLYTGGFGEIPGRVVGLNQGLIMT